MVAPLAKNIVTQRQQQQQQQLATFGDNAGGVSRELAALRKAAAQWRAPKSTWRDWNGEFQAIMQRKDWLELEQEAALLRLSDEFSEAAQRVGRVIISELHLPNDKKTFKPRDMGGVAGGQKYLEVKIRCRSSL